MTLIIQQEKFEPFKDYLTKKSFSFEERPHQYFLARKEGLVVNLYLNGKIVLAGKDDNEKKAIETYLTSHQAEQHIKNKKEYSSIDVSGARIGTDEAGKGDYFGPLVIAGVLADEYLVMNLKEMGVKDSKNLADTTVQNLAVHLKKMVGAKKYTVIVIGPNKYNTLHEKMKNVNKILGWGHARAIENLLKNNQDCKTAISDQFGDVSFIENSLMKHGKQIELIQTPKAEREITVAAASILARGEFLKRMNEMSESYDFKFPKGATDVIPMAEKFVAAYGSDALPDVAKIHFKTTKKITNISKKI